MTELEPPARECLDRTRSAVLNIMVVAGLGIAGSGILLRWRTRNAPALPLDHGGARVTAFGGLLTLVLASYMWRRMGTRRESLRNPARRCERFFRANVVSAMLGALAVPLGLLYGWTVRPQLDSVAPFWVAALALGYLA